MPASPRRSRWRLHRHTRTLKRNPAVFRPRAARTDDGTRRPVETPRSFRCRRAEPIAPRGCPCTAKDAFGIGGNNRGTKQGSVSDAAHSRRSCGLGIRASRCRSGVPHTDFARALWRRDDLFHAYRHHGRAERLPVCAVPVADQIRRRRIPRKGFADIRCHPIRARMCSDAEMRDAPPLMTQHDEYEQNGARGRRDHEEIDRNETARVVVEERPPGLRRRLRMPYHVSRDSRLADIDAQLQ